MKKYDTLFLDRDGVLNKKIEHGYVLNIAQIEMIEGAKEFLLRAKDYFERMVVVTNQRCIGRGLLTMPELEKINAQINHNVGDAIDKFYVCPHLDEDNCDCRKPKAGLFLQAAGDFNTDFVRSWMIGDSESDLIPARRLGIKTFFFSDKESPYADVAVPDGFASLGHLL